MKIASISEIKKELKQLDSEEQLDLIFQLMKFSKENKELLNYILFESIDEENYLQKIKHVIELEFDALDNRSWKTMKKSIQRILKLLKKQVKFSKNTETEIELLLYFCEKMRELKFALNRNPVILNIYIRQINAIDKALLKIHEDLRYDYQEELERAREIV
ncbi:MAG: hypothetical protein HYR91_00090 [Flavobacteriia bacterium]|nr:hypothetical protein [Flavobacteriia bacterium]